MSEQINAFVFLMIIAVMAFTYLKLAFEPIIAKKEFKLWVISWFVVTFLAFFTFNFLLFVLLSALFVYFISRKVENKLALFIVLLFAMPSYEAKFGVLFTFNFTRELSIVLLLPLFALLLNRKKNPDLPRFGKSVTDKFVLFYLGLTYLLYFRGLYAVVEPTTMTQGVRYGSYMFLEMFLPYFVASRYIKNFEQLKTVIIAFIVICTMVGSVGIFEIAKSWLLYGNLSDWLNIDVDIQTKAYLMRGGLLRASSSMDHSLVLGTVMLVALGFYLSFSQLIESKLLKSAGALLIIGGLVAPLARGAWLGAFFMLIFYYSLGHKRFRNISLILLAGFLSIPLLSIIPGGQKVLNFLPFIGTIDKMNVDYRSQLMQQSLLVINNYPFFGVYDPTLEPEMQVMIQGQGIIDLVNYYLQIALYFGISGLLLLLGFFASFTIPLYKHINRLKNHKSIEYLCGKSIFTLLLGVFITISTLSALNMINTTLFFLAGLTVSYIRVTKNLDQRKNDDHLLTPQKDDKEQYPTSRIVNKVAG